MNKNQQAQGAVTSAAGQAPFSNFFEQDQVYKKHKYFDSMVKNFSQMAYINTAGKNLELYPQSDQSDDDHLDDMSAANQNDGDGEFNQGHKKKKKHRHQDMFKKKDDVNEADIENLYSADPNKLDLINNLNSIKLLAISEAFEKFPSESVDVDQFVKIMTEVLGDTKLTAREEFVQDLVDLFFRANKSHGDTIKFEDLTSYLIEHEIDQFRNIGSMNMNYYESEIIDQTTHNNYIEKIFYFQQIDKVILYEQNMRFMRIYDGVTMRNELDIQCPGVILAIEFAPDKNAICVSLSDRTILFYDAGSATYKIIRKIHVPSTQKCLCYVKRKRTLFSAGTDGAIFAWNMDKIFSNDFVEDEALREKEKREFDYKLYITERTPWFVGDIILCVVDLPNINFLATGSYDKLIKLWDLRNNIVDNKSNDHEERTSAKTSNQNFSLQKKTTLASNNDKNKTIGSKKSKKGQKEETKSIPEDLMDDFAKEPTKVLIGHSKAVREIAYSERHKILVSCGFDFEVFVWNPYCEKYIIKLDGHESPLVGVNCPQNLNVFITCDTKGMVKVWNINDYSCVQTFYVPNVIQVTSLRVVPKHRRLVCGSRVFKVFEYTKPFTPEFSDDFPILVAKFSPIRFEFYIAGERSIKIWNAKEGKPVRVLKNIFESDITCMEFDKNHRKLIAGDHLGRVKVFDLLSGVMINELEGHDPQDGEISFIGYGDSDNTIITCGWDRVVKIHMDEKQELKSSRENVLRGKKNCHKKDIICGDYSHNLGLIATGSRDHSVRVWDYERVKFEDEIISHTAEVVIVKFVKPFPLLLTADSTGQLYLWVTKPHPKAKQCLVSWRNMFTLQKMCPITSVDSYYDNITGSFLLIIGDEMGYIRIQDLSSILQEFSLKPVDIVSQNHKRNPWRVLPIEKAESESTEINDAGSDLSSNYDAAENEVIPILKEGQFRQIAQWKAHNDVIKSITYISQTDIPIIYSAGMDKMAKIWNLKGELQGILRQGYMMKANYLWKFPLNTYGEGLDNRQSGVKNMLDDVRKKRDEERSLKKSAQNNVLRKSGAGATGGKTTFSFAGAQMMGMSGQNFTGVNNTGYGGNYKDGNSFLGQSKLNYGVHGYGDNSEMIGTDEHSQKVHKLLEKVRRMVQSNQTTQTGFQGKKVTYASGFGGGGGYQNPNDTSFQSQVHNSRKIGPFSFDIDDEIDTEILTSDEVYKDLKELESILDKDKDKITVTSRQFGRAKKKTNKRMF